MNAEILKAIRNEHGASLGAIKDFETAIGFALPSDYRDFLLWSNGAEGPLGKNGYIALWPVEEIVSLNASYETQTFAPGVVLVGTDGSNTGYGITTAHEHERFVEIPLVGMRRELMISRNSFDDLVLGASSTE